MSGALHKQATPQEIVDVLHRAGIYALAPAEVAAVFGISPPAVYRAIRAERGLRAHRIAGALRVFVKDVFQDSGEYQRLVEATRSGGRKCRRKQTA